ncbi:AAA family ATPase [Mycobacterium seoulense]|uniref:helix-turn-helix transcriptional regulator n=1 Tax=Mycobacterium seoulense TaxID=386911 RepID=UPI003CF79EAF
MSERIVSRQAEEQALAEFLDSAPCRPCAVVIEGEPGIGKTTLWLDAIGRARRRGFSVLTSRAAAAESVLAYAALADLLSDVDGSIWADLPAPQREGLDVALLRQRDGARNTDARAVAAAFLAVIDRLATQGPVVIAIDDLQWLDTSSANVVSFAARRLPGGAALLCTARTEEPALRPQLPSPDAVRRIQLQPLTIGELHQLVMLRLGSSIARPMLLRIHEISGGNPFFALELAREVETGRRTTELSLPSSLNDLVRSRISRAGAGAEDALLAMASLPDPTVQVVAQAIDTAPDRIVELLGEAETHAVVAIDGNRLRFTHPLLAHGVYRGAEPRRRRTMHRRLAELVTEPELRARHLALSDATGEHQTIEALDAAAEIARSRGAPAAAAELLELAISRGGDTPERQIRCARCYFFASDPQHARQLLETSIRRLASGSLQAEALSLLAIVRLYDDGFIEAADLLQRALDEVGNRLELRAPVLVTLSYALFNAGRLNEAVLAADDAVTCAERLGEPQPLSQALSMRVLMHFLDGDGFDEATMRRALELADDASYAPMPLRPRVQNALLLAFTGQLEQARAELRSIRRDATENGEEGELIFPAFHSFLVECWLGNVAEASLVAESTMEIALQLGSDLAHIAALTARAWLAAYAGQESEARRDIADAVAASQRSGTFRAIQWAVAASGFLEVSLGNYTAALDTLEPLLSAFEAAPNSTEIVSASFVPDAVEALIGLGRLDDAEPLIDALERNGRRLDRAWMLAVGARCRAMLLAGRGDLAAATATAERAMTEHERLPMVFERARTQLLLGQLQRRQRHRDAAAATLREALQTFEELGTTLWADRVRAELARGMPGRSRAEGLTPSEQRVAELAVSGMTNRDIATALFISPKTVEVNLSRIYRKLNIRSRLELYRALESTNQSAPHNESKE